MANNKWFVLAAKPNKDNAVIELLIARNVDYYYPVVLVQRYEYRKAKQRPFFSGYIFVNIDPESQQAADLRWLPGVKSLLRYGEELVDVPELVISGIKKQISEINANGGVKPQHFQPGDELIITSGPFKGYQAVFGAKLTGKQRIKVLLNMLLNRKISIEIGEEQAKKLE